MIEAFALLAGRVHHKLDDEFPELTDALLGVLYPHYLAPIPSMSVVQFDLEPGAGPAARRLPHSGRTRSSGRRDAVDDLRCEYRTGYPVTLWPVAVAEARLATPPFPPGWKPPPRTAAALRLQLECVSEMPFSGLALDAAAPLPLRRQRRSSAVCTSCCSTTPCRSSSARWSAATSLQPVVCDPREALGRSASRPTRACCPTAGSRSPATGC